METLPSDTPPEFGGSIMPAASGREPLSPPTAPSGYDADGSSSPAPPARGNTGSGDTFESGGNIGPAASSRESFGPPPVETGHNADGSPFTVPPARGNAGSGDSSNAKGERLKAETPESEPLAFSLQPSSLTARALALGARRVRLLRAARPLILAGLTQRATADALGTSLATLNRLLHAFAQVADPDLSPELCAADFSRAGRRSRWQILADNAAVRQRLQQLYLLSCGSSTDQAGKGRRTGSLAAALEVFALDPLCPPALAADLKAGRQPKPLVNVIRELNDLHEQRLRGPKHSSLNGTLIQRRNLDEILADGSTVPIARGDWWVFDDMSDNLPHWWEGAEGHTYIGRQGLYCYDLTRHWVGVEKIGTVRDSYTAAIILRFLRRLMQAFGKPRRGIVFERSVWMANTIRGVRLSTAGEAADEAIDRPEMPETERTLLQHGIEALGLRLHYTYTPRGKEIEGAFNYLQRIKPMFAGSNLNLNPNLNPNPPVNIGRHAGEFEAGAQAVRRARAGSHSPAELGFLHIDASRDLDLQVMQWINERSASRLETCNLNLAPLRPLTERDLAVFLPEKRSLAIRSGKLTATVEGQPLDFTHPELFASLGTGYRLVLAFDPSEPTLGAALYNDEKSSANFRGWQPGEFIGWADFLAPVARFDWREGEGLEDPQADAKRRFNKHIRTAFGAVGLPRRVSTARDGRGNVAEVEDKAQGSRIKAKGPQSEISAFSPQPSALPASRAAGSLQPSALPTRTRERPTAAVGESEENFSRQAERLARQEARARQRFNNHVLLDD